jgi:hypothetical protein
LLNVTFSFDLTADDYREMNQAAYRWGPVLRHFFPHALCCALVVYLAAPWSVETSTRSASIAGIVTFCFALGYMSLTWHRKALDAVNAHYSNASRRVIFGPHTLTFNDSGLESVGPMHRTFRDWRCVTEVRVTQTQMLISTAFGVVYILPLRAVPDPISLEKWLSDRRVEQPNKSLERTRER